MTAILLAALIGIAGGLFQLISLLLPAQGPQAGNPRGVTFGLCLQGVAVLLVAFALLAA
jgi:hypothetical protein